MRAELEEGSWTSGGPSERNFAGVKLAVDTTALPNPPLVCSQHCLPSLQASSAVYYSLANVSRFGSSNVIPE